MVSWRPKVSLGGQQRLIRLGRCPGWSESLLDAQIILLVSSCSSSITCILLSNSGHLGRIKRIWYLSPMRAAKVQAILRIPTVSPEPPLLAHTSSKSRGTFRQKARSLAPLNGWACTIKNLSWRNARRHKFAWRTTFFRWGNTWKVEG